MLGVNALDPAMPSGSCLLKVGMAGTSPAMTGYKGREKREENRMLKIWGRNTSSNVQKVMWAVGELGLPCERIDVGGAFGKNQRSRPISR